MSKKSVSTSLFDREILGIALVDSFRKLTPQQQWKNPVMFVVYSGSLLTTLLWIQALNGHGKIRQFHLGSDFMVMGHGLVCQLCRGGRRRAQQGASRFSA